MYPSTRWLDLFIFRSEIFACQLNWAWFGILRVGWRESATYGLQSRRVSSAWVVVTLRYQGRIKWPWFRRSIPSRVPWLCYLSKKLHLIRVTSRLGKVTFVSISTKPSGRSGCDPFFFLWCFLEPKKSSEWSGKSCSYICQQYFFLFCTHDWTWWEEKFDVFDVQAREIFRCSAGLNYFSLAHDPLAREFEVDTSVLVSYLLLPGRSHTVRSNSTHSLLVFISLALFRRTDSIFPSLRIQEIVNLQACWVHISTVSEWVDLVLRLLYLTSLIDPKVSKRNSCHISFSSQSEFITFLSVE